MRKALHYVLLAVLSVIIFPALLFPNDVLDVSMGNHKLLAGLFAIMVAWFSKNTLIMIIAGMIALFLLQLFFQGL